MSFLDMDGIPRAPYRGSIAAHRLSQGGSCHKLWYSSPLSGVYAVSGLLAGSKFVFFGSSVIIINNSSKNIFVFLIIVKREVDKMAVPTNIKTLLSGEVVEWARVEFKETWEMGCH